MRPSAPVQEPERPPQGPCWTFPPGRLGDPRLARLAPAGHSLGDGGPLPPGPRPAFGASAGRAPTGPWAKRWRPPGCSYDGGGSSSSGGCEEKFDRREGTAKGPGLGQPPRGRLSLRPAPPGFGGARAALLGRRAINHSPRAPRRQEAGPASPRPGRPRRWVPALESAAASPSQLGRARPFSRAPGGASGTRGRARKEAIGAGGGSDPAACPGEETRPTPSRDGVGWGGWMGKTRVCFILTTGWQREGGLLGVDAPKEHLTLLCKGGSNRSGCASKRVSGKFLPHLARGWVGAPLPASWCPRQWGRGLADGFSVLAARGKS